jgi:chemotaxis protein histidine kinase CheA
MSEAAPPAVIASRARLDALAQRVRRRFFVGDALTALRRLAWLPWLALPLIALLHRWVRAEVIAFSVVGIWVALALAWAWRARRTAYGALARWDDAAGRSDTFSSALVFASEPSVADHPGRLLHLERSAELVQAAAARLPRELPWPRLRWTWLGSVAAVAISLLPVWRPVMAPGDQPLTADQIAAAATEAATLTTPAGTPLEKIQELTDEERRALEELERTREELAASLKNAEGKSPREVLDELEKQARAAEALAKQLGADANAWASEKLLAELRQHPDTADLAEAVLSKKPARAAEESRELAATLKNPELTSEVTERLKATLDRALAKADPEERNKMVDQAVAGADQDLKAEQPAAAGEEFEKLAESFARQDQRDKAREELEKMAERLREAGSSIMGQRGESMKKLAGQPGQSGSSPMPSLQPLGQAGDPSDANSPLPVPGLDPPTDPKSGQPAPRRGTPVPGTGPPPKNAKPLAAIPGTAPKDGKPLALAAPIPGTSPGRQAIPIPGAGGQGPPGVGGTQAGRGATTSGDKPTEIQAAAAQGEVAASPGTDGESFTQSIDGQPRDEATTRAARQSAATFLKEQEQALDTENLPPARREQIRRYFESVRKRVGE